MLSDPRFYTALGLPNRNALNVTSITRLDDFVMKYGKKGFPGVWYFDQPKHSQDFGPKLLDLLEHYTNTGCGLEGVKYEGGTVVMRSHVVVFSNHPPPTGILHKRVYHLRLHEKSQSELKWEMPGQQEDGSFNTTAVEEEMKEKNKRDPMFRQASMRVDAGFAQP